MNRIVICGSPRSGKTTLGLELARELGVALLSTDNLMASHTWSGVSEEVASRWLGGDGPWIVEGVAAARSLRKYLAAHPKGMPCDRVIVLRRPRVELTRGQEIMAQGCATVWDGIVAEIVARGVQVEVRS